MIDKGAFMGNTAHWMAVAVFASGLSTVQLQAKDVAAAQEMAALQKEVASAYKATATTPSLEQIYAYGDLVEVQKDGLKMSALAAPLMESNTYKDGRIGGGNAKRIWGGLGIAALEGMAAGLDPSGMTQIPDPIPGLTLKTGDRCWIQLTEVQRDGVLFKLFTDPDGNGTRYHASLRIEFPNKKRLPDRDEALRLISEILLVVEQQQQAPADEQQAAEQPAPSEQAADQPAPQPAHVEPQRQYDEVAPPPPPPPPATSESK